MNKVITALIASSISLVTGATAASAGTISSPYPTEAQSVVVADFGGAILAVYARASGGCQVRALGATSQLSDDWEVQGGTADDVIYMPNFASTICGLSYTPLTTTSFNGHYIDLRGGAGNDVIYNALSEDTWVFLDGGHDQGVTTSPGGAVLGGTGNDVIISFSTGGGETLQGDQDLDCLCDNSLSASVFDCGTNNSDQKVSSCSPALTTSCEVSVSACANQ